MAPTVEKKIAELEMGLLHLQQNIDIPEITLPVNPVVSAVIKKCLEENRKPKVEDFGDKVEDAQFLNNLQSGVNRWIREIQNQQRHARAHPVTSDTRELIYTGGELVVRDTTVHDHCLVSI